MSSENPHIKLAVFGYRGYKDYDFFCSCMDEWIAKNRKPDCIVSGGCTGVDTMAERYAKYNQIEMKVFRPDWKKYPSDMKTAFVMRDRLIASHCTHAIAFPNSAKGKGTQLTMKFVSQLEKPLDVIDITNRDHRSKPQKVLSEIASD